jgi:repressor LexA
MNGQDGPTERQVQILRAIRAWIADHGQGPTVRQLGQMVGLSSTSSVAYQLARLKKTGLISGCGAGRPGRGGCGLARCAG